jgi:hypothetical protein
MRENSGTCKQIDNKVITKKKIEIELRFHGSGKLESSAAGAYSGGIPAPRLEHDVEFSIHRQVLDENGILNPVIGEDSVQGSFQINLSATKKGYRELGRYLLALAELDTRRDEYFHEHHDHLMSADDRSHVHLIVRKHVRRKRRAEPQG